MKYFYSALVCLVLLLLEEVTTCKSLIVFGSHAREAFPFTNRTEQNRTSGFAASSMGAEACHYATTPPHGEVRSGPGKSLQELGAGSRQGYLSASLFHRPTIPSL
jgi:hypothetical protein